MKTKHIIYLVIVVVVVLFIYNQTKSKENLTLESGTTDNNIKDIKDILNEIEVVVSRNVNGTNKFPVNVNVKYTTGFMARYLEVQFNPINNSSLEILQTANGRFSVVKTISNVTSAFMNRTNTTSSETVDITPQINRLNQKGYTTSIISSTSGGFMRMARKYTLRIRIPRNKY
jgi:hypothetical protein